MHQNGIMKIVYTTCIICGGKNLVRKLIAKDHSVSNELFEIWECETCTLRFTQNVEDQYLIFKYYQSENYISHSDTNKGLVNSIYHKVRGFTLQNKKKLIIKLAKKEQGNILDIGAGTGAFLNVMNKNKWKVTGLEPDESAREKASGLYNLTLFKNEDLNILPPSSFDVITLWHVLEHVHTLDHYLIQLRKLLNSNGKLIIAVPNYTSYDAGKYASFWAGYDVPRHLFHFSPASMKVLIRKHELYLDKVIPMWFDSFYVSLLSEKYETGSFNYLKAILTGLISNLKALLNVNKASSLIYIISK